MQEIGEVVHLAHSGRLVIKLTADLSEGDILYDQKNNRIAKVAELIGPVLAPFASAIPYENAKVGPGGKVYSMHSPASEKRRRHR